MSPSPLFNDEARVLLNDVGLPPSSNFRNRSLFLSKERPTVVIGRTSKRNAGLEAAGDNAWIDSAVMSRNHAQLEFDVKQKKVFIKDIGSLHGTFHNGARLAKDQLRSLEEGDILRFGTSVERNAQAFSPCVVKVALHYGNDKRTEGKPAIFRVPDDSDADYIASDEDMSIRNSIRALRENGVCPAQPVTTPGVVAIDLTSDEDNAARNQTMSNGKVSRSRTTTLPQTPASRGRLGLRADEGLAEPLRDELLKIREGLEVVELHTSPTEGCKNGNAPGVGGVFEQDSVRAGDGCLPSSDDWKGPSSVVSPLASSSAPLSCDLNVAASSKTSNRELVSAFEGEEIESDDAFGLDHASASPASSLHSPTCDCDNNASEGPATVYVEYAPISELEPRAKTTVEIKSPVARRTEQPAGYFCNPCSTILSNVDAEQPSVQSRSEKLPSLDSSQRVVSRRVVSRRVQLPPITTTGPTTPVLSTADAFGAKTGKFEYFAARDHNKLVVQTAFRESAARTGPTGASLSPYSPDRDCDGNALMEGVEEKRECSNQAIRSLDSPFLNPHDQHAPLAGGSTSALLASGAKFLSSPPHELELESVAPKRPELDETSAYQFELSKKSAEPSGATCRWTHVAIHDLVDTCPGKPSEEGLPWLKRKAEDMSKSAPREEVEGCNSGASEGPARKTIRSDPGSPMATSLSVAIPESEASRPTKRLRRFAEVFGYAALGGVAVVSALIATAPTL